MEQTLGKRIVSQRKGLGLTQDQLAEQLDVTAQAVSKWENDQSCPDITMLPKLAEIFESSTDELLGIERKQVHEAELVPAEPEENEPEGLHIQNGHWEFKWDGGRKSSIGIAVWVLLVGGFLLASHYNPYMVFSLWELLWTSALLVFGLFGLFPKFSVFRFGCAFFGGYFLLEFTGLLHMNMGMGLIVPIVVILFGLSLLVDALRKPEKRGFHVTHNGKSAREDYCDIKGERFCCSTCFGESKRALTMPRLSSGTAEVSFGSLTVDLTGCEEVADGCRLELSCSFGELELLVPGHCWVEPVVSTAFAAMDIRGESAPDAISVIHVEGKASFGQIEIKYV